MDFLIIRDSLHRAILTNYINNNCPKFICTINVGDGNLTCPSLVCDVNNGACSVLECIIR